MKSLALIVPVLNEAENLTFLVTLLSTLKQSQDEIVIVDGGSTDGSQQLLAELNLETVSAPKGRASQMNAGAMHSDADILVFLHADTELPANALDLIRKAIADGADWGRFDVRISGKHPMLHIIALLMNWRSRLTAIATGDQVIFMRRELFNAVGGFPEQPLMEDIEISKRLKKISRPACLSDKVITSGRRWQKHGIWKTIVLMWWLRFAYWRGVPASTLAEYYR
ncbi:MAG: TIGR04283 family arsenosugar biosynthesis glycosyltransferase [Gammaproteobacteria bacterium]|nr:TIGR04283 family arsenosugar biosynthesis glycosyltransferase [Gammaproteobacteria bacterium]MDT8371277.1 TIGR04283 family arsenosugar biosynthesis glycosyltransferase [Gammaproteobacteria bacterium]